MNYFAGRALGNITLTPLALLLGHGSVIAAIRAASRRDVVEHILLLGLLSLLTAAVFVQHGLPLLFLPVLPIILATFRIGPAGTAVAIVILAVIGTAATISGAGPLQPIGADTGDRIQFFQFYLAVTVLTVLPVAAVLQRWKRLTSALRLSEARYRLLAEHSTDVVLHLEVDGNIRYVSPSIRHIGGHDPDRLPGQPCWMLIAPEHLDRARAGHVTTVELNGETHTFDYIAVTAEGHERWCESHSRALLDEEGSVESVLCVVRDISKRKALEQSLAEAALTDPLTGLANRRAFRSVVDCDVADRASRSAGCIAVLDIDHFKRVNDRFGHAAGDEVLRGFAQVAKSIVRERDLVARIGGEEFAIFFPATSVKQALRFCDRLRSTIGPTNMSFGTAQIIVTVSGGVADLGKDGIDAALKLADRALYEAKRNGRDQLALVA
jgi:diguanylate cyclase (GGDEF)-like protein/PAS domain S-box-containing protein